jgi:predicted site-specific integrase-resolvase
MVTLPTFLPIPEAARKYGLEEARLRQLVEKGKIRAGVVAGEMVVSEEEVRGEIRRKEDLPEYRQFDNLKGKPIWILKAAEDYRIPFSTLRGWVKKGYIKVIGRQGKRVLLDEQDVAYCSKVYRKGQGKWLFDENGVPYKPKTEPLYV